MRLKLDGLARWLRHSASGRWLGASIGAFYIRLVNLTTRWTVEGRDHYDRALAGDTGVIAVGWHGRLFMAVFWVPRGRQRRHTVAMISNNRDGDLISALVARFRVVAVRGSSYDHAKRREKGGAEAYAGAGRALMEKKALVAITPETSPSPISMIRAPASRTLAIFSAWRGRSRIQTTRSATSVFLAWARFFRFVAGVSSRSTTPSGKPPPTAILSI